MPSDTDGGPGSSAGGGAAGGGALAAGGGGEVAAVGGGDAQLDADAGDTDGGELNDAGNVDAGTVDAGPTKSIRQWATCDGVADDAQKTAVAFAAAANHAFTLIIDCPLKVHVGSDISRPIFVEDGTSVKFAAGGKITVDNSTVPSFVFLNTQNVSFTGWRLEYVGSLPANPVTGGYYDNGAYVARGGNTPASGTFSDMKLTPWYTAHRGVNFDQAAGRITARWSGPSNMTSVFFFTGPAQNITFTDMKLSVPASAGGHQFIPMAFSFIPNVLSNKTVTADDEITSAHYGVPNHLTFTNIDIDGSYMGWQGSVRDFTATHIRSHRYGDLQAADGSNSGGVGKWFAPPHLFYLNSTVSTDALMLNENIHISDVVDDGTRVGVARDRGGADTLSGNALSLKIGGTNSTVDNYTSHRPDGLLDILNSKNLRLTNITASYDSSFLNGVFPGIRWPASTYDGVTIEHLTLEDTAANAVKQPMTNQNGPNNTVRLSDVKFILKHWAASGEIVPHVNGAADVEMLYTLTTDNTVIAAGQKTPLEWRLEAHPAKVTTGASSTLTWNVKNATTRNATGGWSGGQNAMGTRAVTPAAGTTAYGLSVGNGPVSATTSVNVIAQ